MTRKHLIDVKEEQLSLLNESQQKISELAFNEIEYKNSIHLADNFQNLITKVNRLAKIGFWEYDFETKEWKSSNYVYQLISNNSDNKMPSYEEFFNRLDSNSKQKVIEATDLMFKTGKSYDIELRTFNSNNEEIWFRNIVEPIYNEKKEITGKRGVVQNITKEKYLKDLYKEVAKMVKIGSWNVDLEIGNVFWSEEIHQLHETDSKTYVPNLEGCINFYREDFVDMVRFNILKTIETGNPWDFEAIIVTAKNNEIWIRSIGSAEFVDNKCVRLYGGFQEITEKKLAAIELEKSLKSLEDYKYSLDQSAIIAFTDHKGIITYVNDNFCKISGYSREELMGNTHSLVNSNHHPTSFFVDLWKTIASGKVWRGEVKNKTKNGSYYWVDTTIVPFLNEKNRPNQYLAIRFDITERKNTEKEKNRLQRTLENSVNEIYMFDAQTLHFTYLNKGALKNLGYTIDEAKKLTPLDLKVEFTFDSFQDFILPLKKKEKEKVVFFATHKRKDGSYYPVEVHLNLVEENNYQTFVAIILDITERKKAEEELFLTSRRLRLATTSVKMGIWEWDIVNDKLIWDDRMFELYGIEDKNFLGAKAAWEKRLHPDDVEKTTKDLNDAFDGFSDYETDFRIVLQDKSIRYIKSNAIIIRDAEGNPLRMIGSNIDVTEDKNAQLEILRAKELIEISEAKFKSYSEKSSVAIYTTNADGDYNYVNETWLNMSGMSEKDALGKGWVKAMHPDDLEFVQRNWYKSMESKGKWRFEYRFVNKKNKEITWVEGTAKAMYNHQNEFIGYLGTNVNITERKKAEEMYRLMADNTNDIIALHDRDFKFKYISPSVTNILGYEINEFINKNYKEIVHKDDYEELKKLIHANVQGIATEHISYRVYSKLGKIVWLESLISPIFENNEITSFVATTRNITPWMKAKKEIEDYQSSLQKLTKEISMIEEKQKKEIAANIHDHLSQSLVISRMKIVDLEKKPELKYIYDDLEFVKNHISNALENSRKITYELSPPVIYQLGIVDALDWFADETQEKYKINFNFTTNVESVELSEFKSILLFRCVQEAVTNTLKYAEASLITLDFNKGKENIILTLVDNGKGFETEILNKNISSSSGFGLFAVKERIRNLNGELTITSKINVGTKIKISVPL